MSVHEDDHYKFRYEPLIYEIQDISPLLEIKRAKLLQQIQEHFRTIVKKHIATKFITRKYNSNRTLDTLLAKCIMSQYDHMDLVDPVIPYNSTNYRQLKKDLELIIRRDKSLSQSQVQQKRRIIMAEADLANQFNKLVDQLRVYYATKEHTHNMIKLLSYVTDLIYILN